MQTFFPNGKKNETFEELLTKTDLKFPANHKIYYDSGKVKDSSMTTKKDGGILSIEYEVDMGTTEHDFFWAVSNRIFKNVNGDVIYHKGDAIKYKKKFKDWEISVRLFFDVEKGLPIESTVFGDSDFIFVWSQEQHIETKTWQQSLKEFFLSLLPMKLLKYIELRKQRRMGENISKFVAERKDRIKLVAEKADEIAAKKNGGLVKPALKLKRKPKTV